MAKADKKQSYDNLLKRLVENQPAAILPLLFPDFGIEIVEELNIEVLLPPRRTDRVYRASLKRYGGKMVILHVEFESTGSGKMGKRLLVYHALLLEKHGVPVLSLIVYPFDVAVATSPLIETLGDYEILSFKYQTLPLSKQDARLYVAQHAVPMYGLLPVMEEISDELLLQAIDEMVQYYGADEAHLRDELLCFRVLLDRAQRLPEDEMLRVERRIRMFDPLLEEDSWVKEKVAKGIAEGIAEGKAKGIAEGKLESMRRFILKLVTNRFPGLRELAERSVMGIEQLETLDRLIDQLMQVNSESEARAAFNVPPRRS